MTTNDDDAGIDATGDRARRRTWMVVAGVVVLVGAVAVAISLWVASGQRRSDNVAGFARAPVGCDTTLDFEATGTFVLYVETSGEFDALPGECDVADRYDRDDVPSPDLVLTDPEGIDVALGDASEASYDVDGFVGTAFRSVEIVDPGDHVLTVAPTPGGPFAISIGRSPDDGVTALRVGGVVVAIVGFVLGGLLLVLGGRRPSVPTSSTTAWTPSEPAWPSSPPGFPAPPPTTGATGPPISAPPSPPPPPGPPRTGGHTGSPWGPPSPP
jgi:hypothetical protein